MTDDKTTIPVPFLFFDHVDAIDKILDAINKILEDANKDQRLICWNGGSMAGRAKWIRTKSGKITVVGPRKMKERLRRIYRGDYRMSGNLGQYVVTYKGDHPDRA